jgi:glucose/arabinose dehydrogenase
MASWHRACTPALLAVTLLAACGDETDDDADGADGTASSEITTISPGPTVSTSATTAGSSSDDSSSTTPTTPAPTTAPPATSPIADLALTLTEVASLDRPIAAATRPGEQALYIAGQGGVVDRIAADGSVATVVDITDRVAQEGAERGLLGIAFSPDGALLYLHYSDVEGETVLAEYPVVDGAVDTGAERVILAVDQPYPNHNGGQLVVTADGMLWMALGDGGSGGDPENRAQSLDTLLGKILRIDPRPTADAPYGIPPDNPFVGVDGARPEIWAYGLRNPWRFSFDRATGDLWIGDVGQDEREEIDLVLAGDGGGGNFGWRAFEGAAPYTDEEIDGAIPPLFDTDRSNGECSIIGGFVYRGGRIPGLTGAYLFGDYCRSDVMALRQVDGEVVESGPIGINVGRLASFAEDPGGELYLLSQDGPVYRLDPA